MSILAYNRLIDNISQTYFYIYGIRDSIHKFQFKKLGLCLFKKAFFEHYIVYVPTACPTLPYPTLPYPTLPYPTLPYPTGKLVRHEIFQIMAKPHWQFGHACYAKIGYIVNGYVEIWRKLEQASDRWKSLVYDGEIRHHFVYLCI